MKYAAPFALWQGNFVERWYFVENKRSFFVTWHCKFTRKVPWFAMQQNFMEKDGGSIAKPKAGFARKEHPFTSTWPAIATLDEGIANQRVASASHQIPVANQQCLIAKHDATIEKHTHAAAKVKDALANLGIVIANQTSLIANLPNVIATEFFAITLHSHAVATENTALSRVNIRFSGS